MPKRRDAMLSGVNHIALLTADMDRFIDFYTSVFDAKLGFDMNEEGLRHAMVDIGGGAALHPFELPEGRNGQAGGGMFERGHLDHLALNVSDPEDFELLRRRLVEAGASDGTVTDFGAVKTCAFRDPDGMEAEIAIWVDSTPRTFVERIEERFRA